MQMKLACFMDNSQLLIANCWTLRGKALRQLLLESNQLNVMHHPVVDSGSIIASPQVFYSLCFKWFVSFQILGCQHHFESYINKTLEFLTDIWSVSALKKKKKFIALLLLMAVRRLHRNTQNMMLPFCRTHQKTHSLSAPILATGGVGYDSGSILFQQQKEKNRLISALISASIFILVFLAPLVCKPVM